MKGRWMVAAALLLASPLLAEDDYRYGRIRYAESGVTLQRGTESVAEEAETNAPFLPGDRVWTDSGRAEFQFGDGSLVRLDGRSKLDYLSADEGQPGVLRLHSGSLFLHAWAGEPGFEVETPGGLVETRDRGVYRVDVEGDEVWLTVLGGEATLAAGRRRVRVLEGERSYARRGDEPDDPRRFDRGGQDEFARWDEDRESRASWASERRQYIPDEVAPYAGELESHGSWYFQVDAGYVWRPYVDAGWRPYCHGRWAWTAYGWTWVPQESWGWAPSHYGRWDYAANLGWYWIPGRSWGPAWVHWAVGTNYVGWCPRGYRDRVVPYYDRAVRSGTARVASTSGAWIYSNHDQMQAGFAARKPVTAAVAARDVRVIDALHARPTRDLRSVETATRPALHAVRTRPTVGDFVPELRTDNRTTIPAPIPRKKPAPRFDRDDTVSTGAQRPQTKPRTDGRDFTGVDVDVRQQPRRSSREGYERREPGAGDTRPRGSETRPPRRPYDDPPARTDRSYGSTRRPEQGEARPVRTTDPPERSDRPDSASSRSREGSRPADPDRDVLRRMFKPLSDSPRESSGGSARGSSAGSSSSGGRERSYENRPPRGESHASSGGESRSRGGSTRSSGSGSGSGGSRGESRSTPRSESSSKGGGSKPQPSPKDRH